MRACFFGTYNRGHSANRIYADAVRAAGFDLVEIHVPLWEKTRDKTSRYFSPVGLLLRGFQWLIAACRLSWRWLASGGAPVALVGFNGQLDVVLLRLLTLGRGPRIVFAPLVSVTETLVEDRRRYGPRSPMATVLRWIDRLACRAADVVVVDTTAHKEYFVERLGVDPARIAVCHLGVDNRAFRASEAGEVAAPADADGKVEILWFGQYLPLHGLDAAVDAVGRLATRDDVRFVFIGTGPERERIERLLRTTRADVEFRDWVPYEELGRRIAEADIVLGIFDTGVKARMVIPNKIYEAAAMGRPVVTGDTPAVREVFTDGVDVALAANGGADIAAAIVRLIDSPELRLEMGGAAAALMRDRFSERAQGLAWSGPLGEAGSSGRGSARLPQLGLVVLNYEDAESTLRCLGSLEHADYPHKNVLVVDNGSSAAQLEWLEGGMAGRFHATLVRLDENLGYAGGNNYALERLFSEGAEAVLVLNNDTLVTPEALRLLVRTAASHPESGPIGPRISADWPGGRAASVGERMWAATAWLPRKLVRHRWPRQANYKVGGILGCAFLITRPVYERLGGFDERFFAYYEEVEYCLRGRRYGLVPRVEPMAEVAHVGHRGFGGGMTRLAAYLKARNLWLMARSLNDNAAMAVFAPGYFAMIAASMSAYALRGRIDVVRSMASGAAAALRGETGPPPPSYFDTGEAE
jgi:GT2 family glycosyltransferase/glycosyltransferase involved in cell wall biosynthesis